MLFLALTHLGIAQNPMFGNGSPDPSFPEAVGRASELRSSRVAGYRVIVNLVVVLAPLAGVTVSW